MGGGGAFNEMRGKHAKQRLFEFNEIHWTINHVLPTQRKIARHQIYLFRLFGLGNGIFFVGGGGVVWDVKLLLCIEFDDNSDK